MTTVFVFHGIGGSPQENWFPWFSEQLKNARQRVIVPQFPNADRPELNGWLDAFKSYENSLNEDAILIGHSLGGAFALRLLEHLERPVRATFLVASVWGMMGNDYDPLMTSFTEAPYDWKTIRKNGGSMTVFHGECDPYIALEKSQTLAAHLHAELTIIPEGKHLNTSAGFTTFRQLLENVYTILNHSRHKQHTTHNLRPKS